MVVNNSLPVRRFSGGWRTGKCSLAATRGAKGGVRGIQGTSVRFVVELARRWPREGQEHPKLVEGGSELSWWLGGC